MSTDTSLIFDRVSKRYGRMEALKEVSFILSPGTVTGLIGPNGSGKSTALKLLAGTLRPDNGAVTVPDSLSRMGLQTEVFDIPIRIRGEAWLRMQGRIDGSKQGSSFREMVRRLGMTEPLARTTRTYSKGMLKKLGILQAFLGSPPVVLLDEPFEGLDPVDRHEFMLMVREYAAKGRIVLISSHILYELDDACDRVLILKKGALIRDLGNEREDLSTLYLSLFREVQ